MDTLSDYDQHHMEQLRQTVGDLVRLVDIRQGGDGSGRTVHVEQILHELKESLRDSQMSLSVEREVRDLYQALNLRNSVLYHYPLTE